jgi:hypothetical protein
MYKQIGKITLLLLYITFITLILVGAGFITNVLFNKGFDSSCVGLDNETKLNLAKMTLVIFWIIFIPLSIGPLLFAVSYELF